MREAVSRSLLLAAALSSLLLVLAFAQERPSGGSNPNGYLTHGGYFDFENEGATIKAAPSGSGGGKGSSSSGSSGPSPGNGPGEGRVEPSSSPAGMAFGKILGGPPGAAGRGGLTRIPADPRIDAPAPVRFNPALTNLPNRPVPMPAISGLSNAPVLYSQWQRSELRAYSDANSRAAQAAGAWGYGNNKVDIASKSASDVLGTNPSLAGARMETPNRIAESQRQVAISPTPVKIPSSEGGNRAQTGASPAESKESVSEKTYEFSKKAIDISTEKAVESINHDLERAKSRMSKNDFARYRKGAEDTKSVVSGMGKLLKAADYAVGVKKIFDADPGKNTQYETAKVTYQVGVELAGSAAQKGIGAAAKALIPTLAPYLAGPAAIGLTIAQVTLSPEETGEDPSEIVRDTSGKYSLEQKQSALSRSLRAYDQKGESAISNQELLEEIQILQEQQRSIETKRP